VLIVFGEKVNARSSGPLSWAIPGTHVAPASSAGANFSTVRNMGIRLDCHCLSGRDEWQFLRLPQGRSNPARLGMDDDISLRSRCRRKIITVPCAPAAIEDPEPESINIVRRERAAVSINRKLARSRPVEGSSTLNLGVISVGYYLEVKTVSLEIDAPRLVVEF